MVSPNVEQFWAKTKPNKQKCWIWTRSLSTDGYGGVRFAAHRWRAHRLAYTLTFGTIPHGKWVLHRCFNRRCINPDHLYIGTVVENNNDTVKAGRHHCAKMTPAQIIRIRKTYRKGVAGYGSRTLAKAYGLTTCSMRRIVQGKSWKWVV